MVTAQVILNGLLVGAVYALFSSGLTLIWGMMNVVNFAHGDFVMLAMYVAFFVFNTPTAWFAEFAAGTLGVSPSRTVDVNPKYGNIGPALLPVGLHEAAREGRIRRGDLVLCYSVGSVSTAHAAVLRWGDVAIAP